MSRTISLVVGSILVLANSSASQESAPRKTQSPVRAATEAARHVGETGTYEMVVASSKDNRPREVIYLDSEKDFDNEKNLAVLIPYKSLKAYTQAGVARPAEHYRGRRIQVTGKVVREGRQIRIYAHDPAQIRQVNAAKPVAGTSEN
jgi:hypothetical protein